MSSIARSPNARADRQVELFTADFELKLSGKHVIPLIFTVVNVQWRS